MFRFKQFAIEQDKCAMKVGTDGVLLGAWVNCKTAHKVLDVGTGTGLIALMLAQRNLNATITALEIDANAAQQAQANFDRSSWGSRLAVKHSSVQSFAKQANFQFDLIVSNPPFFGVDDFQSNSNRKNARQENCLTLQELLECAQALLTKDGVFALVFPSDRENDLIEISKKHQLHIKRKRYVKGSNHSPIKRVLIELSKIKTTPSFTESTLIIEPYKRHQYSIEYQQLTKDFYLKF